MSLLVSKHTCYTGQYTIPLHKDVYKRQLKNVTYDLHSTDLPNVKTEYEEKFSEKGQPIFRLEAIKPKVQKEA